MKKIHKRSKVRSSTMLVKDLVKTVSELTKYARWEGAVGGHLHHSERWIVDPETFCRLCDILKELGVEWNDWSPITSANPAHYNHKPTPSKINPHH